MASKDQLKKVAQRCSHYAPVNNSSMKSETTLHGKQTRTCEGCQHFTEDHKCDLNLVDPILANIDVKLDG